MYICSGTPLIGWGDTGTFPTILLNSSSFQPEKSNLKLVMTNFVMRHF